MIFSGPNIARNKPTVQYPGVLGKGEAFRAVDGNTDYSLNALICAYTDWNISDTKAWWKVDIGDEYKITGIKIYNRDRHRELMLFI